MSDTSVIPGSLAVRNLFEDLLGRDVTVSPGTPLAADDLSTATVAIFTDNSQQIYGVLALDLTLAANAGAALGLLPAGAAEDSIDEKKLFPNLAAQVLVDLQYLEFDLADLALGLSHGRGQDVAVAAETGRVTLKRGDALDRDQLLLEKVTDASKLVLDKGDFLRFCADLTRETLDLLAKLLLALVELSLLAFSNGATEFEQLRLTRNEFLAVG